MTAPNMVAFFQIGSNEPEQMKSFYGTLFGWQFTASPEFNGNFDMISYADADGPAGGLARTPDPSANHAIFSVLVADVAATLAEAERLGAKVLVPLTTTSKGLTFAELQDTSGNHFGIFRPGPA